MRLRPRRGQSRDVSPDPAIRKPQHLQGVEIGARLELDKVGPAVCNRPCFVEDHCLDARKHLQCASAFHEHPLAGATGNSGDDRHRDRENERARRCNDQHGERADRLPAYGPGAAGEEQRDRKKPQRITVRKPNDRRLRGFCRLHSLTIAA